METSNPRLRWLRAQLAKIFGLDPRGLAAFRVGLGLLLLVDLLDRSTDLVANYTDGGVLPRTMVPNIAGRLSLHMLSGEAWFQGLLFAIAGVAAVAVVLGFRTRLSLFVAWVLLFSVHSRNPLVLYGGDVELRMLVFWSLFLPLDQAPSLDRGWGPAGRAAAPVLTWGSTGYVVQIALIYLVTAALKTGPAWQDGTAIWYALNIDHFTNGLGRHLLAWPGLLSVATWAVIGFERVGPWLLLVPIPAVRTAVVLCFALLHLSFETFMEIGLFPWVSALAWLPLLPPAVWDRLRWPRGTAAPPATLPIGSWLAAGSIAYVLWWNLGSVYGERFAVPEAARTPAKVLRLDQYWDMFAPQPFRDDGWWVVVGTRVDGALTDAVHGGPVSWTKPADVAHLYKNERWRKYMRNLWDKKNSKLRRPYLRWICKTWNTHAADHARLEQVQMVYMREDSPPPGGTSEPQKVPLTRYTCGK